MVEEAEVKWESLPKYIKGIVAAVGVVAAIFLGGVGAASTVDAQRNLPERVNAIELRLIDFNADLDSVKRATAELNRKVDRANCLAVAELEGTNWRRCPQ